MLRHFDRRGHVRTFGKHLQRPHRRRTTKSGGSGIGVKSKHLTLRPSTFWQHSNRDWIAFDESVALRRRSPIRRKVRRSLAAIYFPSPRSSTWLHSWRADPFRRAGRRVGVKSKHLTLQPSTFWRQSNRGWIVFNESVALRHLPDRILSISCLMKAAHASTALSYSTRLVVFGTALISK